MNETGDQQQYLLSFTSGTLYLSGAPIAADLYLQSHDWVIVRESLRANNLLQARAASTATRWSFELVNRLQTLTDDELSLLIDATGNELDQLMWVATCRHYAIIAEFAEEVLRERYLLMQLELNTKHFDAFVNEKALWHKELSEISASTYQKLRSNLFKMLREGGLINEGGIIIPTVLSVRVREQLARRSPSDIRFFPTTEAS